jgi:hypothetical protein
METWDRLSGLAREVLYYLAETDVYGSRLQSARAIRERMHVANPAVELSSEIEFEMALRALFAAGLVEMAHEPYIPPRYVINPAGREAAARAR